MSRLLRKMLHDAGIFIGIIPIDDSPTNMEVATYESMKEYFQRRGSPFYQSVEDFASMSRGYFSSGKA